MIKLSTLCAFLVLVIVSVTPFPTVALAAEPQDQLSATVDAILLVLGDTLTITSTRKAHNVLSFSMVY